MNIKTFEKNLYYFYLWFSSTNTDTSFLSFVALHEYTSKGQYAHVYAINNYACRCYAFKKSTLVNVLRLRIQHFVFLKEEQSVANSMSIWVANDAQIKC